MQLNRNWNGRDFWVGLAFAVVAVLCLFFLLSRARGAPLPFPKQGDRAPEGPWPVGRWQVTVDRDGVPVHFTLQLNADKTGWVNHRDPDRRKPLMWQRTTNLSGHWIEMRNGPDPSIPEAWDIGREWSIWIDGSDPATGKIAGGRMSIRRLP
jgi:hypothetical protein